MVKNNQVTKQDLRKYLKENTDKLENRLTKRILNSEINILGELQKMRDDNAAHQFSHARINDDLQDHEKRTAAIESFSI